MALLIIIFFLNIPILSHAASDVPQLIIIDNQSRSRGYTDMPPTLYPHELHEKDITCSECHPKLFIKKIGANYISMRDNINGKFCGICHDGIKSFGMSDCNLCHRKK